MKFLACLLITVWFCLFGGNITRPSTAMAMERVVFLGDSITAGGRWSEAFPDYNVENQGVPGDTTRDILARLGRALQSDPDLIFIMAGINDMGLGDPVRVMADRYERIVRDVRKKCPDAAVFVQSTLPVNNVKFGLSLSNTKVHGLNRRLMRMAEKYEAQYVDLYAEFAAGRDQLPESYTYDGVHLTEKAYRHWYKIVATLIEKAVYDNPK